jgi:hypothetical protein
MPWKWADAAWKHRLRIENWPTSLKATFPGPGFDLAQIKDSDSAQDGSRNKAMRDMHAALKAAYDGQETRESDTQVVSWTDGVPFFLSICAELSSWLADEMELDDPRDVAIVTCADGTILLRASASKVLLRHLGRREARGDDDDSSNRRKHKTGARADNKTTTKKRKVTKATSKVATATSKATTSKASTTTTDRVKKRKAPVDGDSERPAKRRGVQVPEPTDEEQADRIECCYMWGGKVSKSFWVDQLSSYEGEPSRVQRYTYFYSKNHDEWRVCPKGFEPLLSAEQETYCEVYRMNLGLVNDRS